jgi:hypothetical protein
MKNFKTFSPKVDQKRRLVLTRFYTGVKDSNSFCYQITKINKSGEIDKKFKPLFAFGTDDFGSIKSFNHSHSGVEVKVFKKPFKSVFGLDKKNDPISIWSKIPLI